MKTTFRITFIITSRVGQVPHRALDALARIDFPADRYEVLVVYGRNPSKQRNVAAREALGDFLYFLDDDSEIDPANLQRIAGTLAAFGIPASDLVLGGPTVTPPTAPPLERAMATALSSPLAMGPYRARYTSTGRARLASERELILANLLVSRDLFLRTPGFCDRQYPGEENRWMKVLAAQGVPLVYDPAFRCMRGQRGSLAAVARQGYSYGKGRARHFFENLRFPDALLTCPTALVAATVVAVVTGSMLCWSLVGGYGAIVALATATVRGPVQARFALPLLLPVFHGAYGVGFAWGHAEKLRPPASRNVAAVRVERVKSL